MLVSDSNNNGPIDIQTCLMRYSALDDKIIQILEDQKTCLHIVISILTLGIFAIIKAIVLVNLEREQKALGSRVPKSDFLANGLVGVSSRMNKALEKHIPPSPLPARPLENGSSRMKKDSVLRDKDAIVMMGSTDAQMFGLGKSEVKYIDFLQGTGAFSKAADVKKQAKELFDKLCDGREVKSVVFAGSIPHPLNPKKMRGTEKTLSADSMAKIQALRGEGVVALLTGKKFPAMVDAFMKESTAALDATNVKLKAEGKEPVKPLGKGIVMLRALVAEAESRGVKLFLENRDSTKPIEGGSWAKAIAMMHRTYVFDIGGKGCTGYKPNGSNIKTYKDAVDGKEHDMDFSTNEMVMKDPNSKKGINEWIEAISKRVEAFGLGKSEETKVALVFSGKMRNADRKDILAKLETGLNRKGLIHAQPSFIQTDQEGRDQGEMIEKTHYVL